jgi:glycosyltransferase involved in cell wall biosynthesis
MALWFDVDDLIQYFAHASRPTGIQRLSFEVFRALSRLPGENILFCRRCIGHGGFRQLDFLLMEASLVEAMAGARIDPRPIPPKQLEFSRFGRLCRRLPSRYRLPLGVISRALRQIARALLDLAAALIRRPAAPGLLIEDGADVEEADVSFLSGDWLINLGSAWNRPYEPADLARLRARNVRFAVLVYDLIPELFPEWSVRETMIDFRAFLRRTVTAADVVFTISENTAADMADFLRPIKTPPPIVVLPVGGQGANAAGAAPAAEKPFVLLVSTIEVRKNHAMMFRVWQRLLKLLPETAVPDLVFAGKIGWLTGDFLTQLDNCDWLDGKIRFVETPTDEILESLYRGCLFTVFPSFYEGWGLPITESLSFGKTVAASNRAAIPEAGGDFCTYYDPENIEEATNIIRGLIEHPERVAALEARIAETFRPPCWEDTAAALLAALRASGGAAVDQEKIVERAV